MLDAVTPQNASYHNADYNKSAVIFQISHAENRYFQIRIHGKPAAGGDMNP
jgi:hypothetical protein